MSKVTIQRIVDATQAKGGTVIQIPLRDKGIWLNQKCSVCCGNGHEFPISIANLLYGGNWCPYCRYKGEHAVRMILEETFEAKFPKVRPLWLMGKKGKPLELDGYAEHIALAFEYQGPTHLSDDVRERDDLKRRICVDHGISLIEVDYVPNPFMIESLAENVKDALLRSGIDRTVSVPTISWNAKLQLLHNLAETKGGKCLSNSYLGMNHNHLWKCTNEEHDPWEARPLSIQGSGGNPGSWCPACAKQPTLDIHKLSNWGQRYGLQLLSVEYIGVAINYEWRCENHHIITDTKHHILTRIRSDRPPCKICAHSARWINCLPDKLKTFAAIIRCQSFTRAARELKITDAKLLRIIKALENYLASRLFERRSGCKVITPTQTGIQLYEELKNNGFIS